MTAQNHLAGLGIVHMLEQVAAWVAGEPHVSRHAALRTQAVLRAVYAMAVRPTFVFYRALALAATHEALSPAEQAANLRTIAQHAADLAICAAQSPENYDTRHAL